MEIRQDNKEIVLAERPSGVPTASTFRINDIGMPELKDGQVLLTSVYVSVDPGMRGFMDEGEDDLRGRNLRLMSPLPAEP